jgi:hypothetical protein
VYQVQVNALKPAVFQQTGSKLLDVNLKVRVLELGCGSKTHICNGMYLQLQTQIKIPEIL